MAMSEQLIIQSPVFNRGGLIPTEYTPKGRDISPPLKFGNIPDEAVELVLICEDPDAPGDKPYVHWLVYGLSPDQRELPAGVFAGPTDQIRFPFKEGLNSAGEIGYRGPKPPSGVHHYHFRLFALDKATNLPSGATVEDVKAAIEGHVIGQADYVGIQMH